MTLRIRETHENEALKLEAPEREESDEREAYEHKTESARGV